MKRWAVWIAGAVGALVLARVVLPKASEMTERRRESAPVAAVRDTVDHLQDSIRALSLVRDRYLAQSVAARLPRSSAGFVASSDRDVPAAVLERFASIARTQLGNVDSLAMPVRLHAVADLNRGGNYLRAVVLPANAGEPCIVVLVLAARGQLDRVQPQPRDRMLGTCGFYARFGPPGPGVTAWLRRTDGVYARGDVAEAEVVERREAIDYRNVRESPLAASCAARRLESCERLWESGESWAARQIDTTALAAPVRHVLRMTPWSTYFYPGTNLAELRRLMGDARFALLWQHEQEPAAAYEALEGRSIGEVAYQMLMQSVKAHEPGPLRAGLPLVLGLVVGAVAALWGIARAPRERSE